MQCVIIKLGARHLKAFHLSQHGPQNKKTEESGPPVRFGQRCRHFGNLTLPETKMARLPYCRYVTVGVSSSSGLAIITPRSQHGKICQFL